MAPINICPIPTTAAALFAAYEQRAATAPPGSDADWRRDHLGASLIGHDCDRFLWLAFRWAFAPRHEGRILRLFERGSREEAWVVSDLRAAGFDVSDRDPETGEQWRVTFHGGHFGGGLDGLISGLLEASKALHVLEVKTHNAKSFAKLQKDGVKRSKPQHYAQMQVYMRGRELERAYYVAVCKDNDELFTERVKLDREFADSLIERARLVIEAAEPGPRHDREFPPCVYTTKEGERFPCQFFDLCHGDAVLPAKSCRTCVSATPALGGKWWCELHEDARSPLEQRQACASHLSIPSIVNAQIASVDEEARRVVYVAADGSEVVDGSVDARRDSHDIEEG